MPAHLVLVTNKVFLELSFEMLLLSHLSMVLEALFERGLLATRQRDRPGTLGSYFGVLSPGKCRPDSEGTGPLMTGITNF